MVCGQTAALSATCGNLVGDVSFPCADALSAGHFLQSKVRCGLGFLLGLVPRVLFLAYPFAADSTLKVFGVVLDQFQLHFSHYSPWRSCFLVDSDMLCQQQGESSVRKLRFLNCDIAISQRYNTVKLAADNQRHERGAADRAFSSGASTAAARLCQTSCRYGR